MRVIIYTTSAFASGGVRQAVYQYYALKERGIDVYLCLPYDSQFLGTKEFTFLPETLGEQKKFLKNLIIPNETIIHAYHNPTFKLIAKWSLAWKGVACCYHRGIITRPGNPFPYWLPKIKRIFANSELAAKNLRFHCPWWKIKVLPNAVPKVRVTPTKTIDAIKQELNIPGSKYYIAFTGNYNPVKGTNILLEAFAKANLKDTHLLLMGIYTGHIQDKLASLNIADKVTCLGHVEEVANVLQFCDVFAFPSYAMDSAPNVLLEALIMGKAIVSTDVGGTKEILNNCGILIPKKNVSALELGLKTLIENEELRKKYSELAIERGKIYSVQNRCDILLKEYEKMLSEIK